MTGRPECLATRSRFTIVYLEGLRSLDSVYPVVARWWMCCIVLVLTFVLVACHTTRRQSSIPVITFTQVPESNPGDHDQQDVIEGKVTGAQSGQQIIIYARVGKLWWVQPLVSSPFTPILPGQVWRNETHLGTGIRSDARCGRESSHCHYEPASACWRVDCSCCYFKRSTVLFLGIH